MLGNDYDFGERVIASAKDAGESMWPLPIAEEMKALVTSSKIADLRQHNPKPYGGTLFAAFQRFDYDFVCAIVLTIIVLIMIGEILTVRIKRIFA